MAAVRCSRCRATVTLQLTGGLLLTSYGEAFRSRCRSRQVDGEVNGEPEECVDMNKALERARCLFERRRAAVPPASHGAI
jgi:hypothetical protein